MEYCVQIYAYNKITLECGKVFDSFNKLEDIATVGVLALADYVSFAI